MAEQPGSSMFFPEYDPGETDSDSDAMELEDIPPLPTLSQEPFSPIDRNDQPLFSETPTTGILKQESGTGFRPVLDVPKQRKQQPRYHKISHIKVEDSLDEQTIEAQAPAAHDGIGDRRQKRESSATKVKVERKPAPRKRIPRDPASGLSISKNAVDYRERKEVERQYQAQFVELLDSDIIEQIDEEGGITPHGRLIKAGVRMLERVKEERKLQPILSSGGISAGDPELLARAVRAEKLLKAYKTDVEALWKRLN